MGKIYSSLIVPCIEQMSFEVIFPPSTSIAGHAKVTRDDMTRLHSMAQISASIYKLQVQNSELDISKEDMTKNVEKNIHSNMSEDDLVSTYRRIREIELQGVALKKGIHVLDSTLYSIKNQATVDMMQNVLSSTVAQCKVAKENGLLHDSSAQLIESFQQISTQKMANTDIMDSLDTQSFDIQAESKDDEDTIAIDSNFVLWKKKMRNIVENVDNELVVTTEKKKEMSQYTTKINTKPDTKGILVAGL